MAGALPEFQAAFRTALTGLEAPNQLKPGQLRLPVMLFIMQAKFPVCRSQVRPNGVFSR